MIYCRRAIPVGAQDIGTWATIMQMTAVIAVMTNAGLLCFTMDFIPDGAVDAIWVFIAFQYVVFLSMGLFAYLVDDVPREVSANSTF